MSVDAIVITVLFIGLILITVPLGMEILRYNYLGLKNVSHILHHFGGILETDKGLKLEVVEEGGTGFIRVEYDGAELSRQSHFYHSNEEKIHSEGFYRKDLERLLKKKYKVMKADKAAEKIKENQLDKSLLKDLEEKYKSI